jgi:hypothetical protein
MGSRFAKAIEEMALADAVLSLKLLGGSETHAEIATVFRSSSGD